MAIVVGFFLLSAVKAEADGEFGDGFCDAVLSCGEVTAVPQPVSPARSKSAKPHKVRRRASDVERSIDNLRLRVTRLEKTVGNSSVPSEAEIEEIRSTLVGLEGSLSELSVLSQKNRKEIQRLKIAINNIDRMNGRLRVALTAGFLGLVSFDGTRYTGFPLGIRLSSSFTPHLEIGADVNALISGGEKKLGSQVRGFVGLTAVTSRLSIELGLSSAFCGYSRRALAEAYFITGDIGGKVMLVKGLFLSGTARFGVELDGDGNKLSPAGGGSATIGYEF
ncbi:hypothetical protein JW899_03785 [Candidatus Uhrbacteria bacterium]|nr:hypothetical protein [Candidatus Uhrbacteria bacterium]